MGTEPMDRIQFKGVLGVHITMGIEGKHTQGKVVYYRCTYKPVDKRVITVHNIPVRIMSFNLHPHPAVPF